MKVGVVLQGGSMRGLYSAGVLDVMMDHQIEVDGMIGVSVGALFGPNYFSKQRGRALRYNKRMAKDLRFISMWSFLFTGNIVSKGFAYYKMTYHIDPFDNRTFRKANKDFYATVTNIETGKAEYLPMRNLEENGLEILRASAAIPFFCRVVKINGKKYLDGGVGDNVPVLKAKELGYDKIIVILTQTANERKEPLSSLMMKALQFKYPRYPLFLEALKNRHTMCNENIESILEMEKNGDIFVFCPQDDLGVNLIERDANKMQEVYDQGANDCMNRIEELKAFLKG